MLQTSLEEPAQNTPSATEAAGEMARLSEVNEIFQRQPAQAKEKQIAAFSDYLGTRRFIPLQQFYAGWPR